VHENTAHPQGAVPPGDNDHRAIRLLVGLQHGDQGARQAQSRAVQGVDKARSPAA
jgi:hypothetical protein